MKDIFLTSFASALPRWLVSWGGVIITLAALGLMLVLICKSFKYVRAFWLRWRLVCNLKSLCRRQGYGLEKLSSYYKSVFTATDTPEMLIEAAGKRYCVKFFACLRYADTYTFADIRHYTTKSNAAMTLVNMNPFASGIAKKDPSLSIQHFHKLENETIDEIEVTGGADAGAAAYHDAERILCVNPIPIEMRCVKGSTTVQIFDGDSFDGYTVYSGGALCDMLAGEPTLA